MAKQIIPDPGELNDESAEMLGSPQAIQAIGYGDDRDSRMATAESPFSDFDPEGLLRALQSFRDGDPDEQTETLKVLRTALNENRLPGCEVVA